MNLVKLQDTKLIYRNLFHFYTLTTGYQKEIMEAISVAAGHCCHHPLPPCSLSGQVRTNWHPACPAETEGERKRRGEGERIQGVGAGEPSCATGVYSYKYSSEYCLDCILKLPETWWRQERWSKRPLDYCTIFAVYPEAQVRQSSADLYFLIVYFLLAKQDFHLENSGGQSLTSSVSHNRSMHFQMSVRFVDQLSFPERDQALSLWSGSWLPRP